MFYFNKNNYNECTGHGACSIDPSIRSFQEVMLALFRSIAFYIINLERLNYKNNELRLKIIDELSNLVSSSVYTDEQLMSMISYNLYIYKRLKSKYKRVCKSQGVKFKELKLPLKFTSRMNLAEILTQGQHWLAEKNKISKRAQKCYVELLFVAIKSVSLGIMKLVDYGYIDDKAISQVLNSINLMNSRFIQSTKLRNAVLDLVASDIKLWKQRREAQIDAFGKVSKTSVKRTTEAGKAILVSGSNLMDLYHLLEATKDEDVNIYSHGDLLIAHVFDKFKRYPNFKGHFGNVGENYLYDYATFPGVILLTKHGSQNIEHLIRGRLFTTDDIVPKGVEQVKNKNYTRLVQAAKNAKGFTKRTELDSISIGFNFDELDNQFKKLKENFESGKIKNIFVIGTSNFSSEQIDYFEGMLRKLDSSTFVVSFSHHINRENLLFIDVVNNFPMQIIILELLFKYIPLTDDKITFFLTKCDANTLSSIINLKQNGAKHLYLSDCPPTVINPEIIKLFQRLYDVNSMTTPSNDLKVILG